MWKAMQAGYEYTLIDNAGAMLRGRILSMLINNAGAMLRGNLLS